MKRFIKISIVLLSILISLLIIIRITSTFNYPSKKFFLNLRIKNLEFLKNVVQEFENKNSLDSADLFTICEEFSVNWNKFTIPYRNPSERKSNNNFPLEHDYNSFKKLIYMYEDKNSFDSLCKYQLVKVKDDWWFIVETQLALENWSKFSPFYLGIDKKGNIFKTYGHFLPEQEQNLIFDLQEYYLKIPKTILNSLKESNPIEGK